MDRQRPIFTVGHSTHELEHFLGLLTRHGITAVADVRSQPFSRIPHYNQDAIDVALKARGIKYVFMGRELGARRDEPECYVEGQAVYERVARLPLFGEGIERVIKGAGEHAIALMCSEKEPIDCHRMVLIGRRLRSGGAAIEHILADGELESQCRGEQRLMALMGFSPGQGDLFSNEEELIEQAYEARGREIAYRVELQETAS